MIRAVWRFKRRIFRARWHVGANGAFHAPQWSPRCLGYPPHAAHPRYWSARTPGIPFRQPRLRGPRWRQAWGRQWFNAWSRKRSPTFLARIRAGLFQASSVIAVEMLVESAAYQRLTAHQQLAALRDVVKHYDAGRSLTDATWT